MRQSTFKGARQKGRPIVRHDALDAHAEPLVELANAVQKDQRGALLLVGQDLRTCDTGTIIDCHKDMLVARTAASIPVFTGDAMAHCLDASELLDIDMHQFSGSIFFIAHNGHRDFQGWQPMKSTCAQPAAHTGRAQSYARADLRIRQTLSAQSLNTRRFNRRLRPWQSYRSRAAIDQSGCALGFKARFPLGHRTPGQAERFSDPLHRLPVDSDLPEHVLSTSWSKTCILMNVHSGLQSGGEVWTTSPCPIAPSEQPIATSQLGGRVLKRYGCGET